MKTATLPLVLQRKLVALDLETTGLNRNTAMIVEIGMAKLSPTADGRSWSRQTIKMRINPGIAIEPGATSVHHITDADVACEPPFGVVAPIVADWTRDADLVGFNINAFDIGILTREMEEAGFVWAPSGSTVDVQILYHQLNPRTLAAAVKQYCGGSHVGAHDAEVDADAALDVLFAMVSEHPELPRTVPELDRLCVPEHYIDRSGKFVFNDAGEAVLGFTHQAGTRLMDVEPGLLKWILTRNFPPDVKQIAANALKGVYPVRSPR